MLPSNIEQSIVISVRWKLPMLCPACRRTTSDTRRLRLLLLGSAARTEFVALQAASWCMLERAVRYNASVMQSYSVIAIAAASF